MSHVIGAVAERGVQQLFASARDNFKVTAADSGDFGPFTASYDVDLRLANGTVDMRANNTLQIRELDVKFNRLRLCIGFDIPRICVGGFCIIPNPFGGCILRAPRLCVFDDDPDVSFCLDLAPFVRVELSATVAPVAKYFNDPLHAGLSDLEAEEQNHPNKWQLFLDPRTIDIDLFDVADIVGDLIEDAIDSVLDGILGGLPGWAKDLIRAILGPVTNLIRTILDLGDDVQEWLSDLLGVSLGLFDFILTAVADFLGARTPLLEIKDPTPVLAADAAGPLIPVLVPIKEVALTIHETELVVQGSVGA